MIKPTILTLTVAAAVVFASCSKETNPTPRTMNTYYYTSIKSESASSDLTLFIDGKNMGTLPSIAEAPDPNSATQKRIALHIPISDGTHLVDARAADGTTKSANTITFTTHKAQVRSRSKDDTGGGCAMSCNPNQETIMIELH